MLFFSKPGRVYNKVETKYRRAVHVVRRLGMSLKIFQAARRIILKFNRETKSLGKFQRRFK